MCYNNSIESKGDICIMAVTKMRREVLGRKKSTSCIRIKNGRVIISDPKIIAEMNSESIKKSEKQGLFNALDLGAVWLERALKKQ